MAELNPETELTLHFQLQGDEQAIETEGRITWLGPTQKEAGICFKNLVGNTEQSPMDCEAGAAGAGSKNRNRTSSQAPSHKP